MHGFFHGLGEKVNSAIHDVSAGGGSLQNVFGGGGGGHDISNALGIDKIVAGLKEALRVSIHNSVRSVGVPDGFFRNNLIKILVPQKLEKVTQTLRGFGLAHIVDEFEESLNRSAERAAPLALDVFVNAITDMSFDDAHGILRGEDPTAATKFLQRSCTPRLSALFLPAVKEAIQSSGVTRIYNQLLEKVAFVPVISEHARSFEVEGYTVEKTLAGLFNVMGQEESKIRRNPSARISSLLQEVFRSDRDFDQQQQQPNSQFQQQQQFDQQQYNPQFNQQQYNPQQQYGDQQQNYSQRSDNFQF